MENLFLVLFLLSLLGLIVGLVSPKLVIRWGSKRTRGRVVLTHGLALVAFFILFGVTSPTTTNEVEQEREVIPSPMTEREQLRLQQKTQVTSLRVVDQEQPKEFSELEMTDVLYEDGKVKITGRTDLPDGSRLRVEFDVAGRPGKATDIGVRTEVEVEDSAFAAILTLPNHPGFAKAPYVVQVVFYPRFDQSDVILKLVGKDGEHLEGDKVQEGIGFRYMKTLRQVDLQLEITPYPMVSANSYSADSPERAFAEFLISWQKEDWSRMAEFTQKTWRSGVENPAGRLYSMYAIRELLGAEIRPNADHDEIVAQLMATIYYWSMSEVQMKTIRAMVIRELAPYTPSAQGEWGVNPLSTLREYVE